MSRMTLQSAAAAMSRQANGVVEESLVRSSESNEGRQAGVSWFRTQKYLTRTWP